MHAAGPHLGHHLDRLFLPFESERRGSVEIEPVEVLDSDPGIGDVQDDRADGAETSQDPARQLDALLLPSFFPGHGWRDLTTSTNPFDRADREEFPAFNLFLHTARPAEAEAQDDVAIEDIERTGSLVAAPDGVVPDAVHVDDLLFVLAGDARLPVALRLLAVHDRHADRVRERRQLVETLRHDDPVARRAGLGRADEPEILARQQRARVARRARPREADERGAHCPHSEPRHRPTSGVAAVQTSTGPRPRFVVFNRYTPPPVTD